MTIANTAKLIMRIILHACLNLSASDNKSQDKAVRPIQASKPILSNSVMYIYVANMGLVLYIGGDFILRLRIVLLVGMLWADVMCDMG